MKLYRVQRNSPIGYDEAAGFVVAAFSPREARELCAANASTEGPTEWLTAGSSTCSFLGTTELSPQILLRDFRAG